MLPIGVGRQQFIESISRRLARNFPDTFATKLKKPVFVVGFNNSAKSTMMSALQKHPEICFYPHEGNNEIWFPGFFPWLQSNAKVDPVWYNPEAFAEAVLYKHSDTFLQARAYLGAYQWLMGGEYILNDSGMLAAILKGVSPAFPGAKYIHVLRDGRVVCYLVARREWNLIMRRPSKYKLHHCELGFQSVLRRVALYWAYTLEQVQAIAAEHPGSVYTISYEAWCSDNHKVIQSVADFIGLSGDLLPKKWKYTIENMNDYVLSEYSSQDMTTVIDAIGPKLNEKGYMWDGRTTK